MANYQVMRPLPPEKYEALKADIMARWMVLVPVIKDEKGDIIDGYHRVQVCDDIGLRDYPVHVVFGLSEVEKRTLARVLNAQRRQLSTEEKRECIEGQLRDTPEKSNREIASMFGFDHKTVQDVREGLEGRGEIPHVETRTDSLGRKQPAKKTRALTAKTPQQAEGALKCLELNGWNDGDSSTLTADEVIADTNKTLYSTSRNRSDSLMTSNSYEWYTTPDLATRARRVLKEIDLDPCSTEEANKTVQAHNYFDKDIGGEEQEWYGRVWLNPPYGADIGAWVEKLAVEFASGRVSQALALLPARTDTRWFQILKSYPRCFLHGRIKFDGPGSNGNSATFPSVVVALGCDLQAFIDAFKGAGDVYILAEELQK